MLKKLLGQKVKVGISNYAYSVTVQSAKGTVTDADDNFIELDNEMIIATRAITYIQSIK